MRRRASRPLGVELVDPLLVLVADPDDPAAVDSDGVRVGVLGGNPIGLEDRRRS